MNGQAESAVRSLVVGTAGHIDHGKTALVLALTGTDTDRLPEEKARGITIDLGFAALDLTGAAGERFEVSLIDVPGHHAFVRNMLAGAGGIDAVLLVVAADEGVKAQTVEHLQICRLLGIGRGLVVLTKADGVGPERMAAARGEVASLVEGTFLKGAPVLAVSARTGQGMGELRAALARLVAGVPRRDAGRVARLPVDRVFSMRGFGTVVTGTLGAGNVRVGESLRLEPGERPVRVRGVQVHGRTRDGAGAPNRVALNLVGVEVGEVRRGDVVVPAGTLKPVSVVDAEMELLPGAALRHRGRVRVHAFAWESLATVLLYEGEAGLARLRLTSPTVLLPGDRFVLRQPSPAVTLGGGRVLDAHPVTRLKKAAVAAWLGELRGAEPAAELLLRVRRKGTAGVGWDQLVRETGWTREVLGPLLRAKAEDGSVVVGAGGGGVIAAASLGEVEARLLKVVAAAGERGVGTAELRGRVDAGEWVFALAVGRLRAARRVEVRGDLLLVPGERAAGMPAGLGGRAAEVEAMYRTAGLASPLVSEVGDRLRVEAGEMRGAVTALLRAGKLVRMGSDALLVHADALQRLKDELKTHRGESFDVARFKSFTGLTRKHAIPLLEYLDGARVMRNVGGVRVVM